jgi:F-type H+-transporting ATPase subunit gamma
MSLKVLKQKMKSVRSIKKITKAMKMVAASKMKQDVARLENGKNFGIASVQTMLANETYLQKRKAFPVVKRTLLVPMTSDKGLCGAINSGIVRDVRAMVRPNRSAYKLFIVGEKVPFLQLCRATMPYRAISGR